VITLEFRQLAGDLPEVFIAGELQSLDFYVAPSFVGYNSTTTRKNTSRSRCSDSTESGSSGGPALERGLQRWACKFRLMTNSMFLGKRRLAQQPKQCKANPSQADDKLRYFGIQSWTAIGAIFYFN
jgi:hypothetical protein